MADLGTDQATRFCSEETVIEEILFCINVSHLNDKSSSRMMHRFAKFISARFIHISWSSVILTLVLDCYLESLSVSAFESERLHACDYAFGTVIFNSVVEKVRSYHEYEYTEVLGLIYLNPSSMRVKIPAVRR